MAPFASLTGTSGTHTVGQWYWPVSSMYPES